MQAKSTGITADKVGYSTMFLSAIICINFTRKEFFMKAGKRAMGWAMTLFMVFSMLPFTQTVSMADETLSATIYVASDGDDTTGDGTQANPYKTLAKAKEVVRSLPKTGGDIIVQIADGFYPLDETLVFDANDSGSESCTVRYEAAPGASGKPGGTMLRFQMPYAAISQSLSNNTQYNPNNNQVIRNAFEFLNKRGDFYFDQAEHTLYYIPLEGEDINTADVVIPELETVIDIRGIPVGDRLNPVSNSDEGRVKYITFDGLTFAHTDYKLYELEGTYTLSY
jgi:hypothetical protein